MINIFSRLYKLKKNSDKTPEEDFLTEVFAYLIDSNHELLISFLTHFNILTLNDGEKFYRHSILRQAEKVINTLKLPVEYKPIYWTEFRRQTIE